MKKAIWILLLGLGIPAILVVAALLASDAVLESRIESAGTAAAGADLRFEEVDLALLESRLDLRDMTLENPRGFSEAYAARAAAVDVSAGLFELLDQPSRIERLELDRPVFTLELSVRGTNLGRLIEHLEEYQHRGTGPEEVDAGPGRELEVGLLRIVEPKVVLAQSILGADRRELSLDTIELREVSSAERVGRQTLATLIQRVLAAVLAELAAAGELPAQLEQHIAAELHDLELGHVRERLRRQAEEAAQEAGRRIERGLEEAGRRAREKIEEGVEGVFGEEDAPPAEGTEETTEPSRN